MFVITDIFDETRYSKLAQVVKDNFYKDVPELANHAWTTNRQVSYSLNHFIHI